MNILNNKHLNTISVIVMLMTQLVVFLIGIFSNYYNMLMIVSGFFVLSGIGCIMHLSTIHYDVSNYAVAPHYYVVLIYFHIFAAVWGIAPVAFVLNQLDKCYSDTVPDCTVSVLSSDVPMEGCLNYSTSSDSIAVAVLIFILFTYGVNIFQTVFVLRLHNSSTKNN